MSGKLSFWALIILSFSAKTSFAQQNDRYLFRHLRQEDGLIHNDVFDIAQDKKGFIWIATAGGLQRYDGYRFVNFRDLLNDPSYSSNNPVTICEDNVSNTLWINKMENTERVDLSTDKITYYRPEALLKQPSFATEAYNGTSHISWRVGEKAIFAYDSVNRKIGLFFKNQRPANQSGSDFAANSATGEIWMGSNVNGLVLFDKKTQKMSTTMDDSPAHPLLQALRREFGGKKFGVRRVMLDSQNHLWIATWGRQFFKYDPATHKLTKYNLSTTNSSVSCFYEDNHHSIWVCTENAGLLRYNEVHDTFGIVSVDDNDKVGNLFDYNLFCIFQDREENIWLGTDKGIAIFNPYRQYFRSIHHEENSRASLPKNEINCTIQSRNGDILVATWGGGITIYDNLWRFKKTITFSGSPEYNLVWYLVQNDDGTIWAGCQHGYIHIYDPLTGKVRSFRPPAMNNSTIRCMVKDTAGNIWFGLHNGEIVEWNKLAKKFCGYGDTISRKTERLPFVINLFFDNRQRCWVSTDRGFKQFDTRSHTYVVSYISDKNSPGHITANAPKGIEQLNDTTLLIGTLYGGLDGFNPNTGKFWSIPLGDSVLYNSIYAIKKDREGDCWFTTDYGLFRYQPRSNQIVRYSIGAGIVHSNFTFLHFSPLQNGDWATSSETNIICFHPGTEPNSDTDRVEITGCTIFGAPIPIDSLPTTDKPLRLDYTQNFLTIDFARLRYNDVHQSHYYYRLKAVNDAWVDAGTQAFASYTNLLPGKYQFEVKAGDGGDNPLITSFQLIIKPPFWKTWWFLCLVIGLLFLILYRLVKWRLEVLRMNQKLTLAKLEALRSQMNPHFIFNCLTSIDNLIQTGEKGKATAYLSKFARLIRSVLETSKTNTIDCCKDMETLALYLQLEELRCDKKFTYKIEVAEEIANGDYRVPPLVIQPFVENAIHHGLLNKREKDKQLLIRVTAADNRIHYTIEDNGVGRAKAMEYRELNKPTHQSMGMQISIDRIGIFNQNGKDAVVITDLYDENHQPTGTKVQVTLIHSV